MGMNVFMWSYRGFLLISQSKRNIRYGHSDGEANEHGIRQDAQAALDYMLAHPILKTTEIVVYGQSLGGAVAIDLVSKNEQMIEALVLENTFLSIASFYYKC